MLNKCKKEINKKERIKKGKNVFFLTSYQAFIRLKSIKHCDTKLLTVDEDKCNKK